MSPILARLRFRAIPHSTRYYRLYTTVPSSPTPTKSGTRWRMVLSLFSGLCAFDFVREKLFDYSYPTGESMLATLPDRGSMLIHSRLYANGKGVKLGDCIVIRHPPFPQGLAGKRVIGMPGDYVVDDEMYSVTVGGATNAQGWRGNGGEDAVTEERKEPSMRRVPEGHVWVIGDNLGGSRDSRFYGPVPMGLIVGKTIWMGNGWWDWEYMGGDWTHGQMKIVGREARERKGELVLAESGKKLLSKG